MSVTQEEDQKWESPPPVPSQRTGSLYGAPPASAFPSQPKPEKESWTSSCLRGCMMMSFVFVIGCILFAIVVFKGCAQLVDSATTVTSGSFKELMKEAKGEFAVEDEDLGEEAKTVLQIGLSGTISDEESTSSWYAEVNSSQAALNQIRKATKNKDIDGILLYLNSGGGGITASDILWKNLKNFKAADTNRVVVVMMGTTAASGAYYIAAAADYIVANPTTLTGSIGVIMNSFNVQELATRVGLKSVTIKSGGNKDIMSPFTEMTPEQRQMLQTMVDSLHTRFVTLIAEGRNIEEPRVRAIADGRIFLAPEALEYGLIDEIGYADDAKAEFEKRFGEKPRFIDGSETTPFLQLFKSPSFWGECISRAIVGSGNGIADTGTTFK